MSNRDQKKLNGQDRENPELSGDCYINILFHTPTWWNNKMKLTVLSSFKTKLLSHSLRYQFLIEQMF